MNKINYPSMPKEKVDFENEYYDALIKTNVAKINTHLKTIPYKAAPLNFETLVKLPLHELISLMPAIEKYSDSKKRSITKKGKKVVVNKFLDLFNYEGNQQNIAGFFMAKTEFRSCCYCSIDYINAFADFPDYKDELVFVDTASSSELELIEGIDKSIAKSIIAGRRKKGYSDISKIPASKKIQDNIKKSIYEDSHNHFTLDHLIPQNAGKFYSLCLYNLVPSCYACNSKFKKKIEFKIDSDLIYVSPTTDSYSVRENFEFQIFYSVSLDKIKNVADFRLTKKITKHHGQMENYLRMFKIMGRYTYHKDQILKLIENKVNYSDSKIKELSSDTGISQRELRKMIFGEDLYNSEFDQHPFVKFRRDIAKNNINIKGIL